MMQNTYQNSLYQHILIKVQDCQRIMKASSKIEDQPGFIEKYAVPYYSCLVLFAAYVTAIEYVGNAAYALLFIYLLQYLSRLLPSDSANLSSKHVNYHNSHYYHMVPLLVSCFGAWGVIAYSWVRYEKLTVTTEATILSAQALGLVMSSALNAAHQLFHKEPFFCKAVGNLYTVCVLFPVYSIEHIYFHHKNVGTSKDPITSPKNFNLYSYFFKVVWKGYQFAFQYSKKLFLACMALNACYIGFLYLQASRQYEDPNLALRKVMFFLGAGLLGLFILEITEYIQHYGLIFKQDKQGKKKIRELSSWNYDGDIIFNWLVFRFQRHSGHHVDGYKYYSIVDLTPNMPRFRFSFFEGMFLALIPPLWYYVMNPFVDEITQRKSVEKTHETKVKIIKEVVFFALTMNLMISVL